MHSDLRVDNTELNTSILTKIEKLQIDLVAENKIMDKLVEKTEKAKKNSVKLHYRNKRVDDLESEKTILKSCVSEINKYMHRLVETRDSLLTISVCQHLSEKLQPVFSMLTRLEGVSESDALPKQEGGKKA